MYLMSTQPKSLLGYIICLEVLAVTGLKQALPRMIKAHGEKACQFLIVHSEEDEDHIESAYKLFDSYSEIEKQQVLQNLTESVEMFAQLLDSCYAKTQTYRDIAI